MKRLLVWIFIGSIMVGLIGYFFYSRQIQIQQVTLRSPDNSALKTRVSLQLNKAAPVYIEYWKKGSNQTFRTPTHATSRHHSFDLLLLEPGTAYEYQIVPDRLFGSESKVFSFSTREQSPWMVHNWVKDERPHDSTALSDGLVMLCYRGYPGHIAMVDGKGAIRWYWQDEKLGVRLATLTPRNTILALLAPASKDEFATKGVVSGGANSYYLRTGKIGFVGGTQIAEIDLNGRVLRRIDLESKGIIIHHDLRMDKSNRILGILRNHTLYDMDGDSVKDTLWGDGIVALDTVGNVLETWSAWDHWDIEKDERLKMFSQDRFHFNTLTFDRDSNYLLSSPIENQIWKVNAKTGKVQWKLGRGGDFKMDSSAHFYFQHASHINSNGDLMLFDNGDFTPNDTSKLNKVSRVLSFSLDTQSMQAKIKSKTVLPPAFYTSRMGSAYLLPNQNILSTSSKTGGVLVTDPNGKLIWVLQSYFIPYRAEYVPTDIWSNFIKPTIL